MNPNLPSVAISAIMPQNVVLGGMGYFNADGFRECILTLSTKDGVGLKKLNADDIQDVAHLLGNAVYRIANMTDTARFEGGQSAQFIIDRDGVKKTVTVHISQFGSFVLDVDGALNMLFFFTAIAAMVTTARATT